MKFLSYLKSPSPEYKVANMQGFPNRIKFQTFAILLFVFFTFLAACKSADKPNTKFSKIPSDHSHIDFRNDIKEDEDNNIDTYEYLYNGGGIAIGDLNQDGMQDVLFTGNMTADKIYLNKGDLQFEDITAKSGFASREKWKTGAVIVDVNGDRLPDIYLCYSGTGTDEERANELYINTGIIDGVPHFKESAKAYGLDATGTYTTMAAFFDMDNDGDLDMFMVNHADMFYNPFFNSEKLRKTRHPKFGNRLYRNDNGYFTDISEPANIDGSGLNFGLSVAISDINNDGWSDIYVTNDYDERDFLYLNQHNGSFREVLNTSAQHISESSMGSDIADYNNDEKPDVVVLDMLPEDNFRRKTLKGPDNYDKYMLRLSHGFHHQQMRNTLQLNNGNDETGAPIFSEAGQLAGISNTDWSWAPLLADFDNDGWKDLFISNGILRDMTNLDFVKYALTYSSRSKRQTQDKEKMWEQIRDMKTPPLNNYIFRNNHDLSFENMTQPWGITQTTVSNGSSYADLDNDGDLDLIINCLNNDPLLYRNNTQRSDSTHFLRIQFAGEGKNTAGIGARITLATAHTRQMQEQYLTRGFQSSVDPVMHIGLGNDSVIDELTVRWPGGKTSTFTGLRSDTTLTVNEQAATGVDKQEKAITAQPLFSDITATSGIDFTHRQPGFVDFKIFPLLPFQLSKIGPCLGKADVNRDGLEDLFIGASSGQESVLYLQTKEGKFIPSSSQPWNNHKEITNADALFFDADGDGDDDLYLVSGGAEYNATSKNYQDRIFENDGKGIFKQVERALPEETISGALARATDINKDGLPDIFVGGMFTPGYFPLAPESFVLKNKSAKGKIAFEKDTVFLAPALAKMGMLTDAAWMDIDKDGSEDLIVAGQFMPIRIFLNKNGRLRQELESGGFAETDGWWRRLLVADFDNDGDSDFVAGNLGLNSSFKATEKQPLSIVYGPFYNQGVIISILSYYNGDKNYPWYSKDEMENQVPSIQKNFPQY
ncbi:MAG TPA: VCBS repeat-containing protein, partial [Agriterribacter sp.]|nr:VCBS repeat-containing protein [Agriterribacter sp.]